MTWLLTVAFVVAVAGWLLRLRERPASPRRPPADDIDHAELEAAEREVRDLDAGARPDDGFAGDDWGPGTPRPPERL